MPPRLIPVALSLSGSPDEPGLRCRPGLPEGRRRRRGRTTSPAFSPCGVMKPQSSANPQLGRA